MNDLINIELKPAGKDAGFVMLLALAVILAIATKMNWIGWLIIPTLMVIGVGLIQQKRFLRLTTEALFIDRVIWGHRWTRKYSIHNMKALKFQTRVKSESYTSNTRARVLGIDVTPESTKKYIYYPEVLSFLYKGKRVEIGKGYQAFGGAEILEKLNELRAPSDEPRMEW